MHDVAMKQFVFVLLLAACGGSPKPAPAPAAPPPAAPAEQPAAPAAPQNDLAVQTALTEQYELGKKVYVEKKCASCHGDHGEGNPKNPPVIGEAAYPEQAPAISKLRKGVAFHTAKDVLDFVKAKMPLKQPGTLTDAEAAAVTSWMLSESKVAIDRPLDAANAASVKLR
jgi:cytochrome c